MEAMTTPTPPSPPGGGPAAGGTPSPGQPNATVLVVEDEPAIAAAIAQRLSAEGWRVEVARDGSTVELVTPPPAVWKGIEAELDAGPDEAQTARLRRDLRYWSLRHATARPTAPAPDDPAAQFGSRVTYAGEDGAPRTITITGEDEADPAAGRIAYTAPVARALTGATPGSSVTVTLRGRPVELEVLAVEIPADDS